MAKLNQEREPDDRKGSPPWGTWEELLLAYAVNRFGTNSWDSISSELQTRSSAAIVFTPKHCKQKYLELERRFAQSIGDDVHIDDGAAVPWIEQVRKLRVEELQRELQNFDLYISSLQLKVKKLSEESEKVSCGGRKKKAGQKLNEIEIKNNEQVNDKAMKSGDESVNGSNGNLETGEKSENESTPVDQKPESSKEPVKTEPDGTTRENSDVQSSASRSRNDEGEKEDEPIDSIPVRSLPLIDILLKVHKLGSAVFQRRLDLQEKARYKKLIREHIDLEILQTRLKEGWYSDGNNKFFRDLLLLVNNTWIFFPNESPETVAAIELRQFVAKEMVCKRKQKTDSKLVATQKRRRSPEPPDSMLLKPMIVCRKRSSVAGKGSGSDVMKSDKSFEKKETGDGFLPLMSKKKETLAAGGEGKKDEADSSVGRPPKKAALGKQANKRSRRL